MAISINWATKVITIPQADLTNLGGGKYRLDVNAFRLDLKDLEDSEAGMAFPDTHRHATQSTLSGVTYARQVEIINGYTVEFENGTYQVECVGANHNIADVKVVNSVSLIIGNSAGLITVVSGSGVTTQDKADIAALVWQQVLESTLTAEQMQRLLLAALAGKRQGLGTGTEQYFGQDGVTPRITFVPDANGNGTPVLDPS